MKKIFLFISLIIIACSCQVKQSPLEEFSKTIEITTADSIVLENYGILSANGAIVTDDMLVIGTHDEDYLLAFVPLQAPERTFRKIHQGQGPNELTDGCLLYNLGGKVCLFERGSDCIYEITSDSNDQVPHWMCSFPHQVYLNIDYVSDNRFLTSAFSDSCMMYMGDTLGNKISRIPIPEESCVSDQPYNIQSYLWCISKFAANNDGTKFAYGVCNEGHLVFGDIVNDELVVRRQNFYGKAKVRQIEPYGRIVFEDDNEARVLSVASMKDYVAFLYSGRTRESGKATNLAKDVLIYKWDGQPYARLQLDREVIHIMYCPKYNALYAISFNPEAVVVKYDLSDIIP